MLRFIVERALSGHDENLKAYTIATEALGRSSNFDPQADAIVRVSATRLRRLLEAYAKGPGQADDVKIGLPVGSYAPKFIWRDEDLLDEGVDAQAPAWKSLGPRNPTRRFSQWPAASFLVFALALAFLLGFFTGPAMFSVNQQVTEPNSMWPPAQVTRSSGQPVGEASPTLIIGRLDAAPANALAESAVKFIRTQLIGTLRPFDDILEVKDDANFVLDRDNSGAVPGTYLLEGSLRVVAGRIAFAGAVTHLATGVAIYTSEFDMLENGDANVTQFDGLVRNFAVRLARPYGVIPSHVWRDLNQSKAVQGSYTCRLLVFQYFQVFSRAAFDDAYDCARKLLAKEPNSGHALTSLAYLYVEALRAGYALDDPELATKPQLLDRALKTAGQAVKATPGNARAHSALSRAYMMAGSITHAINEAREALSLNPHDPELQADLGAKLVQAGLFKEGFDQLKATISQGGAQPPWRIIFAALASFQLGHEKELTFLAGLYQRLSVPTHVRPLAHAD